MVAGAHGGHGSSALEHVAVGWSSLTESALTLCLRTEESTARDREFSISPATRIPVTTTTVRNSMKWVLKVSAGSC